MKGNHMEDTAEVDASARSSIFHSDIVQLLLYY